MEPIRKAKKEDLCRIAEIQLSNFRLYFYPIFLDDEYYFKELQVIRLMQEYEPLIDELYVYDDKAVKGFLHISDHEIRKLYVEPVLQSQGIGAELLAFAVEQKGADHLWALELNERAIHFYNKHGFHLTGERKPEEGTDKMLVLMRIR